MAWEYPRHILLQEQNVFHSHFLIHRHDAWNYLFNHKTIDHTPFKNQMSSFPFFIHLNKLFCFWFIYLTIDQSYTIRAVNVKTRLITYVFHCRACLHYDPVENLSLPNFPSWLLSYHQVTYYPCQRRVTCTHSPQHERHNTHVWLQVLAVHQLWENKTCGIHMVVTDHVVVRMDTLTTTSQQPAHKCSDNHGPMHQCLPISLILRERVKNETRD